MSEKNDVQLPFIKTLIDLGYQALFSIDEMYSMTEQEFRQKSREELKKYRERETSPILTKILKTKLLELNTFLTPELADEVIKDLKKMTESPVQNNKRYHNYIIQNGYSIKINNKHETVKFIDFENIKNNIFHAIPEFYISGHEGCYIDCQGFINGLPIFSKEDKSHGLIQKALEEIALHYADTRSQGRGCPQLFNFSTILIASDGQECQYGSITGFPEHFSMWRDEEKQVEQSQQQTLAKHMLNPEILLDILRYFTLHGEKGIVLPKYYQYHSTKILINDLLNGIRENSLIFKTQGSGKTFDMTFFVNYVRQHPKLSNNKLVFFLDRDNLSDNLLNTMVEFIPNGKSVIKVATSGKELEDLLKSEGSEVIVGLIQKSRSFGKFENKSKDIIVISDEAHRTNDGKLKGFILESLPNALYVGMTGTPIESTVNNYGKPKYAYTYKDSVNDKTTVPVIYQGVEVKLNEHTKMIDIKERDLFSSVPEEYRDRLYNKNVNKRILEASPLRISAISEWVVDHFKTNFLATPYKAMVRGSSRISAYLYYLEINRLLQADPKLKHIKAKLVISPESNKETNNKYHKEMEVFSDEDYVYKTMYDEFKPASNQEVRILVVADMGTTGYDVPCLMPVYNDKYIAEDSPQSAFQWATRPNRAFSYTDDKGNIIQKDRCLFVDFANILPTLNKAISIYSSHNLQGYEESIKDISMLKKELKSQYKELSDFANTLDLNNLDDKQIKKTKKLYQNFKSTFEFLLPDKSAMEYMNKFKEITKKLIKVLGHKNYSTGEFAKYQIAYGEKIKEVAQDNLFLEDTGNVIVNGFDLFADDYLKQVTKVKELDPEEQALAYTNTMKSHISKTKGIDPVGAKKLSERVDEILKKLSSNWTELAQEMKKLVEETKNPTEEEKSFGVPIERRPYFNDYKEILSIFSEALTQERVQEFNNFMLELQNLHNSVADLSVNQSVRTEKVLKLSREFKDEFDANSKDGELNGKSWKDCQKEVIIQLNHMLDNIIKGV